MPTLSGLKVAILVTDGFEQAELLERRLESTEEIRITTSRSTCR